MASSGGGNDQPPTQPTPQGASIPYGMSTPFSPSFTSVLGDSWATPGSVDAGLAKGAVGPAGSAAPGAVGAGAGADAGATNGFAQSVMDWDKNRRLGSFMMNLGPQGMAAGMPMFTAQAPEAHNPTEKLMLMALQDRASGGGMGFSSMGRSSGGTPTGAGNRGGYSSSRA